MKVLELTNEELWAIDLFVRQSDHGKPWGEWGEALLEKVFVGIAETEGKATPAIVLFTEQELWAVESQVRHLYREGQVQIGKSLLLKVQRAILDSAKEEGEEDAGDNDYSTNQNTNYRPNNEPGAAVTP